MQTYPTKEQCLAVNGGHAWQQVWNPDAKTFGQLYRVDNVEQCVHCPARRVYRQVQEPKFEWVEE